MSSSKFTDLSWLPSDSEEQFALGFRIISNAFRTRVQALEAEKSSLKHQIEEVTKALNALQKKHSSAEVDLIEVTQRANQYWEENKNLVAAIRKLQAKANQLDSLKQAVINAAQSGAGASEEDDKFYLSQEYFQTAAPRTMHELSGGPSTEIFPRLGKGSEILSTTGGSSPDGRQFFRRARAEVSSESFNRLMSLCKRLGACEVSPEECLAQAESLFVDEGRPDLMEEFRTMIRNLPRRDPVSA